MSIFKRVKSVLSGGRLDVTVRFELLREAVSGTMSQFYVARDRKTNEVVGLKLLDRVKTETFESRFKGLAKPVEGDISMSLDNPLLVKTLEHGVTVANQHYLVMEFLDGPGLNSLIMAKSQLLDGKRMNLMRQMAEALEYVHQMGYIHRDICPRNFICQKDASALKLIDFGLTVPATPEYMQPGNRTGTPNYMAPEIVRRRQTDQRLDIFALGVTMYQLLASDLPWPTQDRTGKAAMLHDTKQPVPLLSVCPQTHPGLAKLVMSCLSVNPDSRPQSATEVLKTLRLVPNEEK